MGYAEGRVERYLFEQARSRGLFAPKCASPGMNGMPDRIVVTPAGTVFVETKAPGGRLSPIQRKVHGWIRDAGGEVHVAASRKEVDALLEDLASRPPLNP